MSFFEQRILNPPYQILASHWELDRSKRPTDTIIFKQRRSNLISAMPKPESGRGVLQSELELRLADLEGQDVTGSVTEFENEMRSQVEAWSQLPNPIDWQVSSITERLLHNWRDIQKDEIQVKQPFFYQCEVVETAIWMTDAAPKMGKGGSQVYPRLEEADITDSGWEDKLPSAIESHPAGLACANNHNLGFDVPCLMEGEPRAYRPDFLIYLDAHEPSVLVVEVKGYHGYDPILKADSMQTNWIPAANGLGTYFGRWGFVELRDIKGFGLALDKATLTILRKVPA